MTRPAMLQLTPIRLGDQDYAVDIMSIREVITPLPITRVPGAPAFVEGVVDLRGRVLPVIDLRRRLELPPGAPTRHNRYVIATVAGWTAALVVDAVGEVVRVAASQVLPAPPLAPGGEKVGENRIFQGIYRQGERALVVLDLARLLTSDERAGLAGLEPPP